MRKARAEEENQVKALQSGGTRINPKASLRACWVCSSGGGDVLWRLKVATTRRVMGIAQLLVDPTQATSVRKPTVEQYTYG